MCDVLGVGWFLTFFGGWTFGVGRVWDFLGFGRVLDVRGREGLGGFWTLERVRDVRGALGEADWVWRAPQLAYTEASCCEAKCFVRARAKGSDKTSCLAAYRFAAWMRTGDWRWLVCWRVGRGKQKARSGWTGLYGLKILRFAQDDSEALRMTVRHSG